MRFTGVVALVAATFLTGTSHANEERARRRDLANVETTSDFEIDVDWGDAQEKSSKECNADDYKIPEGVYGRGEPFTLQHSMFFDIIIKISALVGLSETPIAIRLFSLFDGSLWNCVAAYSNDYRDAFRRGHRPVVEVPETVCDTDTHTSDARAQCMVYMYAAAIPIIAPDAIPGFQAAIVQLTTKDGELSGAYPVPFPMGLHPEINGCRDEDTYVAFKACVNEVAEAHNYTPDVIGSAIVADMLDYDRTSGWNREGMDASSSVSYESKTSKSKGGKGPKGAKGTKMETNKWTQEYESMWDGNGCMYNCANYSDTISYVPRNYPGSSDENKVYWQPLLENDGRGFFYRQEHVTPHIGFTTQPRVLTSEEFGARTVKNPRYNLKLEAKKVTERLANLNDEKKMEVELFDNKSTVVAVLYFELIGRYGQNFTFERVMLYLATYLGAEEDAVLLAWKEKIRHDLVRPTTVVQQTDRYNTPEMVETYAGPGNGVDTFAARDFQPYIRVMPHAEFPSASACICQVNVDTMYAYMKTIFNDDAVDFKPRRSYAKGSSAIEPGITPAEDIVLVYETMDEFNAACGRSRLDGGMHFTAAVPEGRKLCTGFQPKVNAFMMELLQDDEDGILTTYVPP